MAGIDAYHIAYRNNVADQYEQAYKDAISRTDAHLKEAIEEASHICALSVPGSRY